MGDCRYRVALNSEALSLRGVGSRAGQTSTTQVETQMWVPPQSNSASSRVAPSRGDCRKKSYLRADSPIT